MPSALVANPTEVASTTPKTRSQEESINPNIGHRNHFHRYGTPLPTVAASASGDRFTTSRIGTHPLYLPKNHHPNDDEFTFVIFGDRTGGPINGVSVLANAVRDTNLLDPDLVMTVGDLVEGYNDGTLWLEQMKEYRSIMEELNSPWFPVAGNHDIYWRGDSTKQPRGGNASLFEKYFGPLWYAFEHKNCWFITLFSDEGNPATGQQTFQDPQGQIMSEEQFQWFDTALKKAAGANHVFVFLHHPRWRKENYGDDWDRVHKRLVEAGNVSAVFAGHIHNMNYWGKKDGIEYLTLATTGGGLPEVHSPAGSQHHVDIVRVRKDRISMVAYPISAALDVREITPELNKVVNQSQKLPIKVNERFKLPLQTDRSEIEGKVNFWIENPTSETLQIEAKPLENPRWTLDWRDDLSQFQLDPGESKVVDLKLRYFFGESKQLTNDFVLPKLSLQTTFQTKGALYKNQPQQIQLPVEFHTPAQTQNKGLRLDGKSQWISIPSNAVPLGNTFTVECRFKADEFSKRVGLLSKAQSSEYGLFLDNGHPKFIVYLGNEYVRLTNLNTKLKPNQWYHIAGVYDGKEVRLYLDGKLTDRKEREATRKRNHLPLIVGGDTDAKKRAEDLFKGFIDDVRVSNKARYSGESFNVDQPIPGDTTDLLWLKFDHQIGSMHLDSSPRANHTHAIGLPRIFPLP